VGILILCLRSTTVDFIKTICDMSSITNKHCVHCVSVRASDWETAPNNTIWSRKGPADSNVKGNNMEFNSSVLLRYLTSVNRKIVLKLILKKLVGRMLIE
jgi:hypothetical protein